MRGLTDVSPIARGRRRQTRPVSPTHLVTGEDPLLVVDEVRMQVALVAGDETAAACVPGNLPFWPNSLMHNDSAAYIIDVFRPVGLQALEASVQTSQTNAPAGFRRSGKDT